MKNGKRIFSIIMIMVIMVNVCLPFTVMAEGNLQNEPPVYQTTFLNDIVNGLVYGLGIPDEFIAPLSIPNTIINNLLGIGDVYEDGTLNPNGHTISIDVDGNVILQPEFYQMVNDEIAAAITPLNGYFLLEDNVDFIYSKSDILKSKISNSGALRQLIYTAWNEVSSVFNSNDLPLLIYINANSTNYIKITFYPIEDQKLYITNNITDITSDVNFTTKIRTINSNTPEIKMKYDGSVLSMSSSFGTDYVDVSKGFQYRYITTFGSLKIFYSEADYNSYIIGNSNPYIYYPTYVPSSPVTIPSNTVNYITNNPGITNNTNLYNYITNNTYNENNTGQQNTDAFWAMLIEALANLEVTLNNIDINTGGGDGKDYTEILQAILNHVESSDDTLTDFYEFYLQHYGNGGGGTTNIDTTNIEDFLDEINTNLESLIQLYMQNQGNDNCEYDFSELETYLDSLWAICNQNQQTIITEMEENNTFQNSIIGRLNDIYTRLAGLNGIQTTLEDILDAVEALQNSSGTSNEEYLQEIIELLAENNVQNDEIIDALTDLSEKIEDQEFKVNLKNKAKAAGTKASEVFPTCIPWDLQRLVNALSAEPVTPVITVPIVIESINVSEELVIDLHKFDNFASGFRVILVAVFTYGLLVFTAHFIFKNDD